MTLSSRLREYIIAAFSGIYIQSYEHEDVLRDVAQLCRSEEWVLAIWDVDRAELKVTRTLTCVSPGKRDLHIYCNYAC